MIEYEIYSLKCHHIVIILKPDHNAIGKRVYIYFLVYTLESITQQTSLVLIAHSFLIKQLSKSWRKIETLVK